MVSLRGKIWFSIINRIIKKLDTLFDIDKLDNQKLGSSFPKWKKAAFVDISEFKINELEVLKLKNINNKNNIENNNPEIPPNHVFLGLIEGKIFFLPNCLPIIKANESVIQTAKKIININ